MHFRGGFLRKPYADVFQIEGEPNGKQIGKPKSHYQTPCDKWEW